MSLDITLMKTQPTVVYDANITHNLNKMAEAVGIYKHLWRPEEVGITHARQLIKPLEEALVKLTGSPAKYHKYNAKNGWGTYEEFVPWLADLQAACKQDPDAEIEVSR